MSRSTRKRVAAADVAAELLPGVGIELLKELHLLTRDGDLNADSRRKLKQVNHFLGLLRPAMQDILAGTNDAVIVDCGAGKAYLSFLLHAVFLAPLGRGEVVCIETRQELAEAGRERATRLGLGQLSFVAGAISEAEVPAHVDLVVALHACDTATDDALGLGLDHRAQYIAVVPCCQAEVARQLGEHEPPEAAMASLGRHPWHRREWGSHLTNVLRTLVLEAHGYKVTVTELAGFEHSLKNELLLAKRVRGRDAAAEARLARLLAATGVHPKLVRTHASGLLPGAA
jgi:hypothetical protein